MDTYLTKDDTKIMKAIAIIFMLEHHLLTYPERIAGGQLKYLFTVFEKLSINYLGMFGKICISIFFFLGGYGLYINCFGKKYNIIEKVKKLYVAYWKVFLIFIPIAYIFFSKQVAYCQSIDIYARYTDFSWKQWLANFLGVSTSYNAEWWFLNSYVTALITFPLLRGIIEKTHLEKIFF